MWSGDPARGEVRDLVDAGELYRRRQVSLGVLRIRFDRAATRMRLFAPDTGDALRDWLGQLSDIEEGPSTEQFYRVGALLDAFERWSRGPLVRVATRPPPASVEVVPAAVAPRVEPAPVPVEPPPVPVEPAVVEVVAVAPAGVEVPTVPAAEDDEPTETLRRPTTLVPDADDPTA